MDYDNTNRGIFFQETDKKTDKSPDYTGKLDVNGKEYRIAGWKKIGKSGKPFLSLSISEPKDWVSGDTREKLSGYDTAKQVRQTFSDGSPVPDEIHEVDESEPIDLNSIPF